MEESKALADASLAPDPQALCGQLSCWTRPPAHKRAPGTRTEHPLSFLFLCQASPAMVIPAQRPPGFLQCRADTQLTSCPGA